MDEIPGLVKDFLFQHIHGHEELEIVVLLHQRGGQTDHELAEALKIPVPLVADALKALSGRGIVKVSVADGVPAYAIDDSAKQACGQLVMLYASHRFELVRLMSAHAIERVRTRALRTFADCFFVGKRRDDG